MRANSLLFFILVAFFALASWTATTTPYRQSGFLFNQRMTPSSEIGNPDERQHANYIRHLRTEGTIPVLRPGTPDFGETYQSHQPPTYYLLATGWAKLSGADPELASGKRIRYLNVVVGVITLLGVFFVGRWGLERDDIGAAAAMFVGLNPMFIALNSAITNDALLYCFCTWGFAWCLRLIKPDSTLRDAAIVAVLAALAILTKMSGVLMIPVAMLAVFMRPTKDIKVMTQMFSIVVFGSMLLAGWWLLRNNSLYGDPLGLKIFKEAFAGSPKSMEMAAVLGPRDFWVDMFGWWTARSFFGAMGSMDIFYGHQVYRLLFAGALLLVVGTLMFRRDGNEVPKSYRMLAWAFALFVLAQYLQFNLTYFQAQSRYLFPAISVFGTLFAIGLAGWTKAKFLPVAMGLAVLLVGANIWSGVYVQHEFERRISGQR
ncbi:MAG: glycosyltransferase family 39 protein [Chthonomonas sp.]|nr:glycosyltransferase family 39 protein [Chthonomonas sp.]